MIRPLLFSAFVFDVHFSNLAQTLRTPSICGDDRTFTLLLDPGSFPSFPSGSRFCKSPWAFLSLIWRATERSMFKCGFEWDYGKTASVRLKDFALVVSFPCFSVSFADLLLRGTFLATTLRSFNPWGTLKSHPLAGNLAILTPLKKWTLVWFKFVQTPSKTLSLFNQEGVHKDVYMWVQKLTVL